jgi:hypothetical protein
VFHLPGQIDIWGSQCLKRSQSAPWQFIGLIGSIPLSRNDP